MNEKKKIVVHAGDFHADDVMCVALAELAFPGIEFERLNEVTPEMMQDESVIVADIGGGRFDHHQLDARVREDGNRYAACGLLKEARRYLQDPGGF